TVYSNIKYGQCLVEDASGKVGIDFDGAEVEAVQVVNEPTAPPGGGASGVIGGVLSALSNSNSSYRRKESILAPDIAIYVLGEVHQGGLIGKPASGSTNKTFVISHKSEEERTKSLTSKTRWLLVIAVALLVLAVVLAGFGVKVGK
ncbi:MAG TPA: GIDE domain-containing protein, partial [Xanthobacteraceae bacterium]|nr:GIDE domain-containing protein [Xanthobacteraceae bacterium]